MKQDLKVTQSYKSMKETAKLNNTPIKLPKLY